MYKKILLRFTESFHSFSLIHTFFPLLSKCQTTWHGGTVVVGYGLCIYDTYVYILCWLMRMIWWPIRNLLLVCIQTKPWAFFFLGERMDREANWDIGMGNSVFTWQYNAHKNDYNNRRVIYPTMNSEIPDQVKKKKKEKLFPLFLFLFSFVLSNTSFLWLVCGF